MLVYRRSHQPSAAVFSDQRMYHSFGTELSTQRRTHSLGRTASSQQGGAAGSAGLGASGEAPTERESSEVGRCLPPPSATVYNAMGSPASPNISRAPRRGDAPFSLLPEGPGGGGENCWPSGDPLLPNVCRASVRQSVRAAIVCH